MSLIYDYSLKRMVSPHFTPFSEGKKEWLKNNQLRIRNQLRNKSRLRSAGQELFQYENSFEIEDRFQIRIFIEYDILKTLARQMINYIIYQIVICHIVVLIIGMKRCGWLKIPCRIKSFHSSNNFTDIIFCRCQVK